LELIGATPYSKKRRTRVKFMDSFQLLKYADRLVYDTPLQFYTDNHLEIFHLIHCWNKIIWITRLSEVEFSWQSNDSQNCPFSGSDQENAKPGTIRYIGIVRFQKSFDWGFSGAMLRGSEPPYVSSKLYLTKYMKRENLLFLLEIKEAAKTELSKRNIM
jgi:hypothetical protein